MKKDFEEKATSRMINMRYPQVLIDKIDDYQKEKGFITRTNTIVHLLQLALENEKKKG